MTEDFLHYIWKFQRFSFSNLKTTNGLSVQVVHPGYANLNAGPDFIESKIYIDNQLWVGNVEIHISSSDWAKHKHQNDPAYNNVILHVVYHDDTMVFTANNQPIPTVQLKDRFDENLYWNYEKLLQSKGFISCESRIKEVDLLLIENLMERVLVERLEAKTQILNDRLIKNNGNWLETFYQWLAYGFGLKINTYPMLMLATALPFKLLAKTPRNPMVFESLFFGTAGMLEGEMPDEYASSLQKEFSFLRNKYNIKPLEQSIWKYARLRPPAFPDFRIALFASLCRAQEHLFSKVLETGDLMKLIDLIKVESSEYWKHHYRLGLKSSKAHSNQMGKESVERMVINVLIPFLFLYAKQKDEPFYKQRALDLLDQLKAERNRITRAYEAIGFKNNSAFYSQALLQLHKAYCEPKKCLNCTVGNTLLKN